MLACLVEDLNILAFVLFVDDGDPHPYGGSSGITSTRSKGVLAWKDAPNIVEECVKKHLTFRIIDNNIKNNEDRKRNCGC